MAKTIRIRQVRSGIGYNKKQKEVLRSLGLRKIRHEVEREDSAAVRGMVFKIRHLVEVIDEHEGASS